MTRTSKNTDDLADRLQRARAKAGMSQDDAARASGITIGQIRKLEQRTSSNPTLETMQALADAYGVNVSTLIPKERRARRA